ncbi:MAG: metallophosphoesterase family protein [Waddliaceae bacterium]
MRYALFLIALFSTLSAVDQTALYLTLSRTPESGMIVNWITGEPEGESFSFQQLGNSAIQTSSVRVFSLPNGKYLHRTELSDLFPGSTYQFQIGNEDKKYRFRTLPKDVEKPLNFVMGGDLFPGKIEPFARTCRQAAQTDPYFALLGGDIAYTGASRKEGKEDFDRWMDFFITWSREMVTSEGYLIPILAAIGNHEVNGHYNQTPDDALGFYSFFRGTGEKSYQAVNFGNYMSLVLLDSDHTYPVEGGQELWLEEALKVACSYPRKFVTYHVPAYPSVRRWTESVPKKIRKYWTPLFDQYDVTAVFENHDHAYKRTYPIRNHTVDPKGIIYFGDGGWGTNMRRPKKPSQRFYLAKTKSARHFILVSLHQNKTFFNAIDENGKSFDNISKESR